MNDHSSILSQVIALLHRETLNRIVSKYKGHEKVRHFTCRQQFICMVFAQLTWRDGLRSIQDSLNARPEQLHHLGFNKPVSKSTLADANETRDWHIWEQVALHLIRKARKVYGQETFSEEIDHIVYALDSTTIDLSLTLFPWAHFRSKKAGIKIHTQLEIKNSLPIFVEVTAAKMSDVKWLDNLTFQPDAIYVFDRGYIDYSRFQRIEERSAFFITRSKSNTCFARSKSINVDYGKGVLSDQIGHWQRSKARKDYPGKIRRIRVWHMLKMEYITFFTNHLSLPPDTIALLYKERWKVELFFKWIKQNLRIKHFYGTSINAVKTQIWTAIATYTMVAIIHKQGGFPGDLHRTLQILSIYPFEKVALYELLTNCTPESEREDKIQQLTFNDL